LRQFLFNPVCHCPDGCDGRRIKSCPQRQGNHLREEKPEQPAWNEADVTKSVDVAARPTRRSVSRQRPLVGAYVSLLLFMAVYCLRPEDWIPGLSAVPLAKVAGILALLALAFSLREIRSPFPREVIYLFLLVAQLFLATAMSTVWRGGALQVTLDFAKVLILVIVMAVAVKTEKYLRRLIFIQAASVAAIAAVAVWKGQLLGGRLEGVLGGNYSNPNDLALAIVISLPLCLALLFLMRNWVWKASWILAMLVMIDAVFLTGSRGGFISLIATTAVCLWEFGIVNRKRYLFVIVGLAGAIFWLSSSGMLAKRLQGTFNSQEDVASSYGSAQQRQGLFWRSVEVTEERPIFGVGPGNFEVLSGNWHASHNTFTQMSSEGGLPAFLLLLLILFSGFNNVRKIKKTARRHRSLILLVQGLHASLAGYVTGALFANTGYQFFPYFLVAYTTALLWIATKTSVQSKQSESLSGEDPDQETFDSPKDAIDSAVLAP
jgi:putative inorganic carbon (HCO3(-)) transporter